MQESKIAGALQTLTENLNTEFRRFAVFCRNLWLTIRWFRRNREYRKGVGEVLDGMPLPDPRLMSNVTGIPDVAWYLVSGKLSSEDIVRILKTNGIHLCGLKSILDFGCGCGRVIRHMLKIENSVIHGVDVDHSAVEWCQSHLSKGHFKFSNHMPSLDYADSKFNLVYALSIFTHLTTDLVVSWMAELRRVTAPGGYLIFTTNGETFIRSLDKAERLRFLHGSPVVKSPKYSGDNLCRAYHPYEFVCKELKQGLTLIDFAPGGAKGTPGQDLYLFRKK